ncbi:hypothetical protein F3K34_27980 [Streptomyces sp. LBUM 1486]|uniref:hypothetical protein n=1 Tax=Streptomyces scabiei TaxID=1930 RepID=UPI001B3257A8|nr:hypothetical protein [Streptomyces sp. LBUM 1486]MBP5915889.1 hypothetical protein [Streptomyces sp. LBUM 1486]
MGYELRRELRTTLGPGITGLQRAVALEIADDARHGDDGRVSHASLDDLVAWTGAKDINVVRNALKRLSEAGWEFRVPIGKGKDGRTLYAVPGKRMTFRVPNFEGVAPAPSEGATAPPCDRDPGSEGVAGARSEGAGARSEGAGARSEGAPATPSPHTTSHRPQRTTPEAGEAASDTDTDTSSGTLFGEPAPAPTAKTPKRRATASSEPTDPDAFEAFWEAYPVKVGKPAVIKQWNKELKAGVPAARIVQAAADYAAQQRGVERQFIKLPKNWLNDGYYDAEPSSPQQPGRGSQRTAPPTAPAT